MTATIGAELAGPTRRRHHLVVSGGRVDNEPDLSSQRGQGAASARGWVSPDGPAPQADPGPDSSAGRDATARAGGHQAGTRVFAWRLLDPRKDRYELQAEILPLARFPAAACASISR